MKRTSARSGVTGPDEESRPGILGGVLRAFAGAAILLALLLLGWVSFWTFANPSVRLRAPAGLDATGGRGGDTGSVLVLGDTSTGDRTRSLRRRGGEGYQFEDTRNLLAGHDAVVANLESPVTDCDSPWPLPKSYVYKMSRASLEALASAGVDAVALSNNHIYDYGARGLADTLANLDDLGVRHLGAHMSEAGARRGLVVETRGGKLGLLSVMQDKPRWRLWYLAFALDAPFRSWPGAARLDFADVRRDLAELKRHADVAGVLVHWGENYKPVSASQRTLGRALIELGADIVVGHHPHWVQPVAEHEGKLIVYSVGNYAFGTIGNKRMRYGMGVSISLCEGEIERVELVPILTQNRIVKYRPRVARGREARRFFEKVMGPSASNGAVLERVGDRAAWTPRKKHE